MRSVVERVRAIHASVPVIVFTKGGGQWLERIADIGCDAVGIDWTTDIGAARRRIGARVAIQGNLDPIALLSTPKVIESQARAILAAAGNEPGHVFNLGHGIVPSTPVENVEALVECVHQATGRPDFDARATYGEMAENRAPRGSSRS
jgi:uroporphyrinogen decarboxylase